MRIASIKLKNWECYRGEQQLDLEAKTYAIVAMRADNPEASNWAGKSSLLRAIEFGLYGRHAHPKANGWISEGETSGEVVITLDDGARITRSRSGSAATKVWWYPASGGAAAMGDEAEKAIVQALGLTAKDFRASSYFEQRAMGRIVLMDAGPRMELVSEWLRMGPLQQAEQAERDACSELVEKAEKTDRALSIQTELRARALADQNALTLAELRADQETCTADLAIANERLKSAREASEANERLLAAQDAKTRLDALVADGKALAAAVDAGDTPRITDHDVESIAERATRTAAEAARLGHESNRVERELAQKRKLAAGQFDGACPVAPIACPARAQINAMRTEHEKAVAALMQQAADADQAADAARSDADDARAADQDQERRRARLDSMRNEAARLQEQIEILDTATPRDRTALANENEKAQRDVVELRTERDSRQRAIADVEKADAEIARLQTELASLRTEAELARACLAVIGKQGIQRRLAEGALGDIEALANDMLTDAGVGLSVAVRWSREGSGLATSCDACGLAFPTSAKVKACTRCNTVRGPNLVNKLEIELSNRSGAAEDLAGGAVQLAASAWLREDRSSAWSVALIDEPFSQMDKFNRRAFAQHLTAFLSRKYAVDQAFVISHSPDTVEMLPGRIEIVSDGKWARARVVG